MAKEDTFVTVERNGPVATITLDRPEKRNALGDELLLDLNEAIAGFRDDPETRVIVLTAAPPVFSAGAQTKVKVDGSEDARQKAFAGPKSQFRRLFERAAAGIESLEQITVAKVGGHAVGAGWGLTLACDFRVASDDAMFWIPEIELGVLLGVASTARFVRLVGAAKTKEIVILAKRHTATELKHMGLLTQTAPQSELDSATDAFVADLVKNPFIGQAKMKARINHVARTAVPEVDTVLETILER